MHLHTNASRDSMTTPAALVATARQAGLHRIAVTDHNAIDGARAAHDLAPDLVIVGEEILLEGGGELIAYYVRERIPPRLPVDEVLLRLRSQGAIVSVSHPLDRFRREALGEERTRKIVTQIDALEVFNARCLLGADNRRAANLAAECRKAITAGSDAHTLREVGAAYLLMPPFENTPEAFLAGLPEARAGGRLSGFWPHIASTWAKRAQKRKRQ